MKKSESFDQVIFISDVHFGKGGIEKLQIITDYFDNFFIPFVRQQKKIHNPCVVIAGDYFDNRQSIDINVLNVAIDVMKNIAKECEVYVIIGNHDIYKNKETDVTSLKPFMKGRRASQIDSAMRLMQITKLSGILRKPLGR